MHVIYSTKNREPFLRDVGLRRGLEGYLAGTRAGIECPALGLRAVADHMHALCRLGQAVDRIGEGLSRPVGPLWERELGDPKIPGLRFAPTWALESRPFGAGR